MAKQMLTTPVACLVNQLLYSISRDNSATRWGLEQEQHRIGVYTSCLHDRGSLNPIINIKCGLVVCVAHPLLVATPDGWVSDLSASPSQDFVEF